MERLPVGVNQSHLIAISADIAIAAGFHVLKIVAEDSEMKQQYDLPVHNGSTGTKLARAVMEFPSMQVLKSPSKHSPEYLACGNPA